MTRGRARVGEFSYASSHQAISDRRAARAATLAYFYTAFLPFVGVPVPGSVGRAVARPRVFDPLPRGAFGVGASVVAFARKARKKCENALGRTRQNALARTSADADVFADARVPPSRSHVPCVALRARRPPARFSRARRLLVTSEPRRLAARRCSSHPSPRRSASSSRARRSRHPARTTFDASAHPARGPPLPAASSSVPPRDGPSPPPRCPTPRRCPGASRSPRRDAWRTLHRVPLTRGEEEIHSLDVLFRTPEGDRVGVSVWPYPGDSRRDTAAHPGPRRRGSDASRAGATPHARREDDPRRGRARDRGRQSQRESSPTPGLGLVVLGASDAAAGSIEAEARPRSTLNTTRLPRRRLRRAGGGRAVRVLRRRRRPTRKIKRCSNVTRGDGEFPSGTMSEHVTSDARRARLFRVVLPICVLPTSSLLFAPARVSGFISSRALVIIR